MSAKHTPGPWISAPSGPQMQSYGQGHGVANVGIPTLVAGVFSDVSGGEESALANAHLIAAAPDLLAALENLTPILEAAESNASGNPEWKWVSSRINTARAAIAKAEGRQ